MMDTSKNSKSLDSQVKLALGSWDKRKETKDVVPEYIVFNEQQNIEEKVICGLEVQFRKNVQKNHFMIEGSLI